MAEITRASVKKKLQLGLQRLEKAGDDRDGLGIALTTIHGALEDYLRLWLAQHPNVPAATRDGVLDRGAFSWRDLLTHLDQYGEPEAYLQELRAQIPRFNALRQEVAHGGEFDGTREELTRYGKLVTRAVKRGIGNIKASAMSSRGSGAPRRLHDPIALERLREQKLARLDREWRMQREQYMVRDQNGRRQLPTKWVSILTGVGGIVFGIIWISMTSRSPTSMHGSSGLFPMVGPIAACVLLGYALYCYSKAAAYGVAEARYQQEREDLLTREDL